MPGTTKQTVRAKNVHPRKLLTSLFAIMLCIALFTSQISALTPILVDGNPTLGEGCVRIPDPDVGTQTWKIGSPGVETNPSSGFTPSDFWIKTTVVETADGEILKFESNYYIKSIVVKGGSAGANSYTFESPINIYTGIELHAPLNPSGKYASISHIDFCFGDKVKVPGIEIIKKVSVDGGETWKDANKDDKPYPVLDEKSEYKPMYKIVVTNTGDVDLTGIELTDTLYQDLIDEKDVPATLAKGATFTVAFTADWEKGEICNEASVVGMYGDVKVSDSDTACYYGKEFEAKPKIDVEKEVSFDGGTTWHDADEPGLEAVMDIILPVYRITVKNTGNVTLTDLKIWDEVEFYDLLLKKALLEAKAPHSLEAGVSFQVFFEAPWEMGKHYNNVIVTAMYGEIKVTDNDIVCYEVILPKPMIDVEKEINVGGKWMDADEPGLELLKPEGGKLEFRFTVTNTGKYPLAHIMLTDDTYNALLQEALKGKVPMVLEPGKSFSVTIMADWHEGVHHNVATVIAKFLHIDVKDMDEVHYVGIRPEIDVEKWVSFDKGTTWDDADEFGLKPMATMDMPRFKFIVKNTGNVPLSCITLVDDKYGMLLAKALEGKVPEVLKPGESFEVWIEAPWVVGEHCNIAKVTAEYKDHDVEDSDKACYEGYMPKPFIDIEKYVSVDGGNTWADADVEDKFCPELDQAAGIKPMFKFVVKNMGNVPLTDVHLIDVTIQKSIDKVEYAKILAVGASFEVIIEADWNEGKNINIASAVGLYGKVPVFDMDSACYLGVKKAVVDISVVKTVADAADGTYGDLVEIKEGAFAFYKVAVKNTGNVALTNVILTDDRVAIGTVATIEGNGTKTFAMGTGEDPEINLGMLNPGQEVVVTYKYQTGLEDVDETIDNVAKATGMYGKKVVSDSDGATIIVTGIPLASSGIMLEKWVENVTAGGTPGESATGFAGDVFKYTIKITNTGDTNLTNVVLHDDRAFIGSAVTVTTSEIQAMLTAVLMWTDAGGHAKLDLGMLPAGASLTLTYLYTADTDDVGKSLKNIAKVTAEFEGIPLESSDFAIISIQSTPPRTGESENRTMSGIALLLSGAIALVLRRRYRFNA